VSLGAVWGQGLRARLGGPCRRRPANPSNSRPSPQIRRQRIFQVPCQRSGYSRIRPKRPRGYGLHLHSTNSVFAVGALGDAAALISLCLARARQSRGSVDAYASGRGLADYPVMPCVHFLCVRYGEGALTSLPLSNAPLADVIRPRQIKKVLPLLMHPRRMIGFAPNYELEKIAPIRNERGSISQPASSLGGPSPSVATRGPSPLSLRRAFKTLAGFSSNVESEISCVFCDEW
jgi:hypothetical protein